MMMDNNAFQQLVVLPTLLFILIFATVAMAVGVGLLFDSPRMLRLFDLANYYISTRHGLKALSIPHHVERAVRRHRHLIGIFLLAGASYSLVGLLGQVEHSAIAHSLGFAIAPELAISIVEPIRWSLLIGNATAVVIGIMLLAYPSALRHLEYRLNHWYSLRQLAPNMDAMHLPLDRWVAHFPRTAGGIILAGALFVVADLGMLLFRIGG